MPIHTLLLPEYHFVYTRFEGNIDNLQVRAWSDRMKKDLAGFTRTREIMDLSGDIDFRSLSTEVLSLAGAEEKNRPTAGSGPLAIRVADPLTYGLARVYSSRAESFRSEIRIFHSLADCLSLMGFSENLCNKIRTQIQRPDLDSAPTRPADRVDFNFASDD